MLTISLTNLSFEDDNSKTLSQLTVFNLNKELLKKGQDKFYFIQLV